LEYCSHRRKLDEREKFFSILKLLSAAKSKEKAIYKLGKVNFFEGQFDEAG